MVQDLVNFARLRGVRVIPEFDTPSHFSVLFNTYPQFAAVAYDSNNNSFLCLVDPSKEETFTFLESVWTEIVMLFPDSQIHIGGAIPWRNAILYGLHAAFESVHHGIALSLSFSLRVLLRR
jgi:N-acetyl-beta-hexosaminidase